VNEHYTFCFRGTNVMAQFHPHAGGYEYTRVVGGQPCTVDQAFLRLSTDSNIDVVLTGDGAKTVLALVKEAAMAMAQTTTPAEPTPEWAELLKVVPDGVTVTITLGVGAQYQTPKVP
jgi:hypothetical protein